MGLCSGNWVFSGLLNSLKVITYLSLARKGICLYLSYADCINWQEIRCHSIIFSSLVDINLETKVIFIGIYVCTG